MEEYEKYDNDVNATDKQRENESKAKLPAKHWLVTAMVVYGLLILSVKIAMSMAENGTISEESFLPGGTILFFASLLYFLLLKSYLRWYHMFRFWIESTIVILATVVATDGQSEIADRMSVSILAADFIYILTGWIPFLIVAVIQKIRAHR